MSAYDFDLFVIGGGSGGVRAARMAAQRGARVALAEMLGEEGLGGTCVNVGCIPKKLYSYAAHYSEAFAESRGYGWSLPEGMAPVLDWATLKANRAQEIGRLNGVYGQLLRGAGVTVFNGFARIDGAHEITLATLNADGSPGHQAFTAQHILIATGGTPQVPDVPGREHVITSNEVFDLDPFPQRLVIVGGGYIACEFASIFNGLGARVTQLYRGQQVLRGFDDEVRHFGSRGNAQGRRRSEAGQRGGRHHPDGRGPARGAGRWWRSDRRCGAVRNRPSAQRARTGAGQGGRGPE